MRKILITILVLSCPLIYGQEGGDVYKDWIMTHKFKADATALADVEGVKLAYWCFKEFDDGKLIAFVNSFSDTLFCFDEDEYGEDNKNLAEGVKQMMRKGKYKCSITLLYEGHISGFSKEEFLISMATLVINQTEDFSKFSWRAIPVFIIVRN